MNLVSIELWFGVIFVCSGGDENKKMFELNYFNPAVYQERNLTKVWIELNLDDDLN